MTAAATVLIDLRSQGIRIRRAGDVLKLAPPERVTSEVIERVRSVRADLLELLGPETSRADHKASGWSDSLHDLHSHPVVRADGNPGGTDPVASRVEAMLSQAPPTGPVPILTASGAWTGGCVSCGDPVEDLPSGAFGPGIRCTTCTEAARIAIERGRAQR